MHSNIRSKSFYLHIGPLSPSIHGFLTNNLILELKRTLQDMIRSLIFLESIFRFYSQIIRVHMIFCYFQAIIYYKPMNLPVANARFVVK